jgi:hypothetical protein
MSGHFKNVIRYVFCTMTLMMVLAACGPVTTPVAEVIVQPALLTPTLEPTFTPSASPTDIPEPSPIAAIETTLTPLLQASLSGRIIDQETGQPIAGVKVSAGTATATTDTEGRYSLTELQPGQYVLSVTHPDYDPELSSIYTLAATEELEVDLALYAPDTSPYPQDPMLTNPLDPNGAPTEKDAERLAREQGLTGKVVNIAETKLSGEYLVNYNIGDDIRAAVAELNHEAWELTDEMGRKWWIIKVCGNLASPLPQAAPITTPVPRPLPPLAEVVVDGVSVRVCASEECAEVGTVQRGARIEVFGCLADGGWCEVGWSGGRGWCTGQSLRQLAVAQAIPVVEAPPATPQVTVRDDVDWIAYLSQDRNIWLIDPATGEQRQLTYAGEPAYSAGPAWSPDGTKLVIGIGGSFHPDKVMTDLAIIDLGTGDLRRLGLYAQGGSLPPVAVGWPTWSADGSMIYYSMTLDGLSRTWQMRRVRLNGESQEEIPPISRNWWWEGYPAFSPDGHWMTYGMVFGQAIIERPDDNWGIWLADTDGGNPRQGVVGGAGKSAWAPNSAQVAYGIRFGPGERGIFVINIDGSGTRRLTDDGQYPTWSPDGQQIAFMKLVNDGSASEIWLMNADGTNRHKLTDGSQPAWRPARRQ